MDDAHLLSQYWRERSEAAFTALVRRHLNLVYSAALRRVQGDAHRAEDICQMVFAEVARQAGHLCRRPSLEGWLYTTTRNIAVRHIRAEQRRVARERAAMVIEEPEAGPPLDADQLQPLIHDVLERLSNRDREVVLLRFFRNSTFIDIARRYGITEDAARFRLNRALDRMRSLFAKNGITSTPALIGAVLSQQANAALTDATVTAVTSGALAQAAAPGVGGGAFLLHVMTTTQTAAVACILLACAGGFWLRHDQAALQSAQAELAAETRAYESAIARLNTVQAAARSKSDAPPAASSLATATTGPSRGGTLQTTKAAASLTPSATTPPAAIPPKEEINWLLSRDPEIRATLSTWIGSSMHAGMAAFYRQTGLPPETTAALDALMLQNNIYMGPNALLTLRPENKAMDQVYAEMRELLGDMTYGQLRQYLRSQFVGAVSIGVAALTYDSATPLTPLQADQLTQLLMNQTAKPAPFPKDINWAEALPQAKAILSPAQYAALESLAATVGKSPAAVNPLMPGTFGDPLNPPPSLYATTPKP